MSRAGLASTSTSQVGRRLRVRSASPDRRPLTGSFTAACLRSTLKDLNVARPISVDCDNELGVAHTKPVEIAAARAAPTRTLVKIRLFDIRNLLKDYPSAKRAAEASALGVSARICA